MAVGAGHSTVFEVQQAILNGYRRLVFTFRQVTVGQLANKVFYTIVLWSGFDYEIYTLW